MKGNAPNINHIVLADLTDNNRLIELYRQAVQRRIWRDNSERDFIEFVNRAMKALHANSQEHPALLFRFRLRYDLEAILTVHPGFKFKQTTDALTLFDSDPPVPRTSRKQL